MPRNLITDWKRIGRSGPTIDGRVIPPEAIDQAAKNYDKELFAALIWPEHFRYLNLGKVEELRSAANSEGGRDLYAKLAPNEFYISANAANQKLFTSMELIDNFRDTGEYYLVGLGATDDPASAATSEIRFSVQPNQGQLIAQPVEALAHDFPDPEPKPSLFQRLISQFANSEEDEMADKAALQELQTQFKALSDGFSAFKQTHKPDPTRDKDVDAQFDAAIEFKKLAVRLEAMEKRLKAGDSAPEDFTVALATLDEKLTKLSADLAAALAEAPGTRPDEHTGSGDELAAYI